MQHVQGVSSLKAAEARVFYCPKTIEKDNSAFKSADETDLIRFDDAGIYLNSRQVEFIRTDHLRIQTISLDQFQGIGIEVCSKSEQTRCKKFDRPFFEIILRHKDQRYNVTLNIASKSDEVLALWDYWAKLLQVSRLVGSIKVQETNDRPDEVQFRNLKRGNALALPETEQLAPRPMSSLLAARRSLLQRPAYSLTSHKKVYCAELIARH